MNLLKTTFYDEFACIGAECPLTCCGGWMIAMEGIGFMRLNVASPRCIIEKAMKQLADAYQLYIK